MSVTSSVARLLLRSVVRIVQALPLRWMPTLGYVAGTLMKLNTKRRTITKANVDNAFPDATETWKGAVVHGSYVNLGITLVELMQLGTMSRDQLMSRVTITGLDEVADRLKQGKPSIFVSGHMGNWEWMAAAAGLSLNHPITIVTHPQASTEANNLLDSFRTRFGNRLVPMHSAARTLVHTLSAGGVVAFLADQHASAEKDPWIEFFGRETPTYSAPAALSLRMNAPIFFGVAERQEDYSYIVNVRRLPSEDLNTSHEAIIELTRRHVAALENAIRQHPELWSWQHRRWRKPKPPSTTAHDENRYATTQ